MSTQTKTVVFTDMVDFTKNTARADRAALRELVTLHEAHTRRLFEPHGGVLVKNIGDSFLALFDSATLAIRACLDLVSSQLSEELPLGFRASAATGDVEVIGGDCFGEAVNLSSRINKETPAGQVWFADRTRLCMNQAELPWEPIGTLEFKGIPDPVVCYRAVPPGQCILAAPLLEAARAGRVHVLRGELPNASLLSPRDHIVLVGDDLGSPELAARLASLPQHVQPGHIWCRIGAVAGADRRAWTDRGHGLVVGDLDAMQRALVAARPKAEPGAGLQTMLFEDEAGPEHEAQIVGLGLPAVPFGGVVEGYTFELLPSGWWGFASGDALARLEVRPEGTDLHVLRPDLLLDGRRLRMGETIPLRGGEVLTTPHGDHRYIALQGPYRGAITGPPCHSVPMPTNAPFEIGREPQRPGLPLPARGGAAHVRWLPGPRAAKARESNMGLDRAQIGRQQTRIAVRDGGIVVEPVHDRLRTWCLRDGRLAAIERPTRCQLGDLLVIGTYVVLVR